MNSQEARTASGYTVYFTALAMIDSAAELPSDEPAKRPALVVLGGFLGAGKTTLIITAARMLMARGQRVAAILNDQGEELVDTALVRSSGVAAEQVTGGCFCCQFGDLIDSAERLRTHRPDVIFAEAAGSCADISATTLQPLKLYYGDRFRLAPFTVLIDPRRALDLSQPDADPDFVFLFERQMEEADVVCYTKSDCFTGFPALSAASDVRHISPRTGAGVAHWLDYVLNVSSGSGRAILDIDYARYAGAEAVLAWVNCRASIVPLVPLSPAAVVGPLLEELDRVFTARGIGIAHLKALDECASGSLKASITRNGGAPGVQGALDAAPAETHHLLLNLRVAREPAEVQNILETTLTSLFHRVQIETLQCFRPAVPKPEHRLSEVVTAN